MHVLGRRGKKEGRTLQEDGEKDSSCGTKTFKQKMKKVEKWAEDPAAAAAWMMHKATGKWPSEK
jgi:hypothetical protein